MDKIPTLDAAALAVFAWAFGAYLGPILGTLFLITFGWFLGVIVGLWRLPDGTRIRPLWFVVVTFGATVGSASVAATWIAQRFHTSPMEWLFFVAIAIPAIGEDWVRVARWAWGLLQRAVESRLHGGPPPQDRSGE